MRRCTATLLGFVFLFSPLFLLAGSDVAALNRSPAPPPVKLTAGDFLENPVGHNLEKILDTIRVASPETEFIVVTPMLNNPKRTTGPDPITCVRDEALKISQPGTALVDITTSELDLLKRKDYLDLSGNGTTHPNDFLQRIYAQRILEVPADN